MPIGNLQGRARTSRSNPAAKGECDRCGTWYPLSSLRRQYQWSGARLADTGSLVCARCLDVPFEQNRALILPPDPYPRINPRMSQDGATNRSNQPLASATGVLASATGYLASA